MTSSINLAKHNSSKLDKSKCKNRENLVINIHWYSYSNSLIVCNSMLKYIMVTGNVIPSFVRLPSKVQMHLKKSKSIWKMLKTYLPGKKIQIMGRKKKMSGKIWSTYNCMYFIFLWVSIWWPSSRNAYIFMICHLFSWSFMDTWKPFSVLDYEFLLKQ